MFKKSRILVLSSIINLILTLFLTKTFATDQNEWMYEQIQSDFAYFQNGTEISKGKIFELSTDKKYEYLLLARYSIRNNQVRVYQNFSYTEGRVAIIKKALETIARIYSLPDMDFIISMHDELSIGFDIPIFTMAKKRHNQHLILIPDFDALQANYQVLKGRDITKITIPWERKKSQLIWRGSTAQAPFEGGCYTLMPDNIYSFSRVILCSLSEQFPKIIDAKFTFYAQGGEKIPFLKRFEGSYVSYESQLKNKYHILIDGNSCAYSASGWKLFTNSLIFKPDSNSIQWYYNALKPFEHYVPVKADLSDLLEKIEWAHDHDDVAATIAQNVRNFAINNITKEKNLFYLYLTLLEYSTLNFTE